MKTLLISALALAACVAGPACATTQIDTTGDLVGGIARNDLDIRSFSVFRDGGDFVLSASLLGLIDPASDARYVFGINRGGGGAPFAGHDGIRFNTTAVVKGDGSSTLGAFTVKGDVVSGRIAVASLVPNGLDPADFGFSLWTRPNGAAIVDFAPDNSTFKASVPEPATWAMMVLGFGAMGAMLRGGRRRSEPALG
ncbi:MAG TPA: PEPxxWA-CTERM sorting domain-containing protein [Phenylobacterium sp.]|nr:PEPxxWA-CTERM sorting domain-containing protein [Phenylobacterium sp.]